MSRVFQLIAVYTLLFCVLANALPALAQSDGAVAVPAESADSTAETLAKFDPAVRTALAASAPDEMMTVIVTLQTQADLAQVDGDDAMLRQSTVIGALQATAAASQHAVTAKLAIGHAQGQVGKVVPFWIFNGFSLSATPQFILEVADQPEVARITADDIDIVPAQASVTPEPNVGAVQAPALWALGRYGQGVVVASLDSGVDASHPDLAAQWRGGANSWFDPHGQHPDTPVDLSGHGTWTMGVIVGRHTGGTGIGVAPYAKWIAAKIFNDQGKSTATAIHLAFQWLLDPDGDPSTADAPQVVNNSWSFGTPGCDLAFELDLEAISAAGILPIFAAGNFGPAVSTSASPANNPAAFAVGAVDNGGAIYSGSSRGPAGCGEPAGIFPELVAPGVDVRTSERFGTYIAATGTSLAAPHVAGVLALLLSAFPNLSADQQREALLQGAEDLGAPGPDNDFGAGRVDALAAYQSLTTDGQKPQARSLIVVTTTKDEVSDNVQCGLREAILAANANQASGGCSAGAGADTIVFDPALPQPALFKLTRMGANEDGAATGDLDISGYLTITGSAANQTIVDGNDADRVFEVLPGGRAVLMGMTVRNGHATLANDGGGIKVSSSLRMTDVAVVNNQGGGISNQGGGLVLAQVNVDRNSGGYGIYNAASATLIFTDGSLRSNRGGGLYNATSTATLTRIDIQNNNFGSGIHNEGATLTKLMISAATVISNSAESGAGIFNQGTGASAVVHETRIANNVATSNGGGVFNNGDLRIEASAIDGNHARAGAGIEHFGGSLALTNVTISANEATDNGGGLYNGGNAVVMYATLSGNRAGGIGGNLLNDEAQLAIGSSIVANPVHGENCGVSGGAITSQGYNLESGNGCGFAQPSDLSGTDPRLGALMNNGGATPTHALLAGSPAIDLIPSGVSGCGNPTATDQRGVVRPEGPGCDAGAYEATFVPPATWLYLPQVVRDPPVDTGN